jgi:DNA-binding response OmpR family regulator
MDSTAWLAPLAGQTILVVDDETLISPNLEATLLQAGAEVLVAGDQGSGLAAAADIRLTACVLAVHLGKNSIDPICEALDKRWVPFLFLTADSGSAVERWSPAPILPKAFVPRVLIDAILGILVTGRDAIGLGDKARIDVIIFRAQSRLARQVRCAEEVARRGQDSKSANALLSIMRESVALLLAHRVTLADDDDEIKH